MLVWMDTAAHTAKGSLHNHGLEVEQIEGMLRFEHAGDLVRCDQIADEQPGQSQSHARRLPEDCRARTMGARTRPRKLRR